jgi:DNA topoisomerase I
MISCRSLVLVAPVKAHSPWPSNGVARLRASADGEPGFSRRMTSVGFVYRDVDGKPLRNVRALQRIERLAIPPAWKDVWICSSAAGHLQATGIDARGRKQYLYHPKWRAERDEQKHDRILQFAERLPALRRTARRDLRRAGVPRERALAAAVLILDRTAIRVGSERYARSNGTYGLATIRSRHLTVNGQTIVFDFTAKGGKRQRATVTDAALSAAVQAMDELPGHEVLSYIDDDGRPVDVTAADVNAYIKRHAGDEFSAKDFRTWAATVAAAVALAEIEDIEVPARKQAVVGVVRTVASLMGNTPAVCRASYIDPRVIQRFLDGETINHLRDEVAQIRTRGLSTQELLVMSQLTRALDTRRGGGRRGDGRRTTATTRSRR